MTRLFRYIPHVRMPDALALGWLPVSIVPRFHHCAYSVLSEYAFASGAEHGLQ